MHCSEYACVRGPMASDLQIPPFTSFRETVFSHRALLWLPLPCQQRYMHLGSSIQGGKQKGNTTLFLHDLPTYMIICI